MTTVSIQEVLSLSPLQEGLYFESAVAAGTDDTYVSQLPIDITGPLRPSQLKAAAVALLARHPNLRSAFRTTRDQRLVQVVASDVVVPWRQVDLSAKAPEEQREALQELAASENQPFNLSRAPLIRFLVCRMTPEKFRFIITKHHILLDGWSMPILLRELFTLYSNGVNVAELPPVAPYKHYLSWLASRPSGDETWRKILAGLEEPTIVAPTPTPRGHVRPAFVVRDLSVEQGRRVEQCARAHEVTVNTVVQTAWGMTLGALLGRRDVVFGTTVSGRPPHIPGIESMIGLFINTVPMRVRWDLSERVSDVWRRLQGDQLEVMDYQHEQLSRLQQIAGYQPLFDTITVFQNYPLDVDETSMQIGDLTLHEVPVESGTHYPLSLAAGVDGGSMRVRLSYRPDVIDHDAVEHLLDRMVQLLNTSVTVPDGRVADLPLVLDNEASSVLSWAGDLDAAPMADFVSLIEGVVDTYPQQPAIRWWDGITASHVTYAQLDRRANAAAHALIAQGVRAEDVIGLAISRSIDLIVAMVAVAKAGAAYLPLDVNYPRERIAYMLDDAEPRLVLVDEPGRRLMGEIEHDVPMLVMEEAVAVGRSQEIVRPSATGRHPHVQHPLYLIYTSGSTGHPKAVVVTHRGVGSLVETQKRKLGTGPGTLTLQFASTSFDAAFWEITQALLTGGELLMAPAELVFPGDALRSILVSQAVTHATLTPSVLATTDGANQIPSLRVLVTAGEACYPELITEWGRGRIMMNGYGPTETTVAISISDPLRQGHVPDIGSPVVGLQCHVLDAALRPVPLGTSGELYAAGAGLARGYLGRPALTAARFVASPTGDGIRLYRTGDLAHWSADGVLVFDGRADEQVKVRGFRIEPGEIRSELLAYRGVKDAAVVGVARNGDIKLRGYVVTDEDVNLADLRQTLAERLPSHMVPATIQVLDALPVTPNGKVDKRALPEPNDTGSPSRRAPRPGVEQVLAGLFQDLLGCDQIGANDSFFDLGGHSLLATRLVGRIHNELGISVPVRTLFEAPTVALLADAIAGADGSKDGPDLGTIPRPAILPLSTAQQRLWILDRMGGDAGTYTIPVAIRLVGALDVDAMRTALDDVVRRHEALRTIFPEQDGQATQVVLDDSHVDLPLRDTAESDISAIVQSLVRRGFDLTSQPPIAAFLLRISAEDHVLVLALHHIIADGWSMAPLARDLGEAYSARCRGAAPQFAPLPVQYADFALWQREVLGSGQDPDSVLSLQANYWRDTLADAPDVIDLATDRPRPAAASKTSGTVRFHVPAKVHQQITELCSVLGATPFTVLHSALSVLLGRLGAGNDVCIGTPVAGRGDPRLDGLIGFFVNTLVLRSSCGSGATFAEHVQATLDRDLAALSHADLPFEQLVEILNPERSLSRHPFLQVMLTLQNTPAAQLDLPGLHVSLFDTGTSTAKYDLAWSMVENSDDSGPAGLDAQLTYRSDLWDHSTAEDLAARFVAVLEQAMAAPTILVDAIDVLLPHERDAMLRVTKGISDPSLTAVDILERRSARCPEALAVLWQSDAISAGSTSYGELNTMANEVAHRIIGLGIGPEDRIGVCLPRDGRLLPALLGVLKSGAAYVPLDPMQPSARLCAIMDAASPKVLITGNDVAVAAELTRERGSTSVLALDDLPVERTDNPTDETRVAPLLSRHPAYVLFTSGSAEAPKGVVVEHASLSDYIQVAEASYPAARGTTLLHSPITFDLTVTALYTTLASGGTVLLAPMERSQWIDDALAQSPVTFAECTPSHLPLLELLPDSYSPSRQLLLGGEGLFAEQLTSFRRNHPDCEIRNVYGPTELTVNCTQYLLPSHESLAPGAVPIGRAFPGTRAYVLDQKLRLVPEGVIGELYVAGVSLARGYLNQAATTAATFVADPFGPPHERMYRTGDLVRWRHDGELVWVSRSDDQFKLRGHRIEPSDIEAALLSADGVEMAAIRLIEDRIIGYVYGTAADGETVRSEVARTLPSYMVPSIVVVVDRMPESKNGKIDRSALPVPDFSSQVSDGAPMTEDEVLVCQAFADVLGLASVGRDDSFFALGGHSLLTVQLVRLVRERAGVEIAPFEVFSSPTPASLADRLQQGVPAARDGFASAARVPRLLPLAASGSRVPVFCVHPAFGLGTVYAPLVRYLSDTPVYALQAPGFNPGEAPARDMDDLVSGHLEVLREACPAGPCRVLGWSFGGVVAHAMCAQLLAEGRKAQLVLLDAYPHVDRRNIDLGPTLAMLAEAGVEASQPLSRSEAVEALAAAGSAFSSLPEAILERVTDVAQALGRIANAHQPLAIDIEVDYFYATAGRPANSPKPQDWLPYVTNGLRIHPLDCTHNQMTSTDALSAVAALLNGDE